MAKTDPRIDEHNPRTVITDGAVAFDAPKAEPDTLPQDQGEDAEATPSPTHRGHNKKTKIAVGAAVAVAAVAGVAGLSLFKGGDARPNSTGTEEPVKPKGPKTGTPDTAPSAAAIKENLPASRSRDGLNRWYSERNSAYDGKPGWAERPTSVPGGGVNFPEGSNPVNQEFGDIILTDWQSREAVMSTGVEDTNMQWLEGMVLFLEYDGKVYAIERPILYGCFVDEDNLNDKTPDASDPKVTFYSAVFKMPDGSWQTIFLEEDGVGFPSLEDAKAAGLFLGQDTPAIFRGRGSVDANGALNVTDQDDITNQIPVAREYKDLDEAYKSELEDYDAWQFASMWKLTEKFPAAG